MDAKSLSLQIVVSWVWIIISVEFCRTCSRRAAAVARDTSVKGTICLGRFAMALGIIRLALLLCVAGAVPSLKDDTCCSIEETQQLDSKIVL